MINKDLYKILGVTKSMSCLEIKKKFYALAMKLHPDHGGNPTEFIQAREAYDVLTDEIKRADYDRYYNSVSYMEHEGWNPDKPIPKTRSGMQRMIKVEYDHKRGGYVYQGNLMRYDSRSGTWRFGDSLGGDIDPDE